MPSANGQGDWPVRRSRASKVKFSRRELSRQVFEYSSMSCWRVPRETLMRPSRNWKHDQEFDLVDRRMWNSLSGEIRPVQLVTAITRQETVIIWPIKLPAEDGRSNLWAHTARQAAEQAKSVWTRMRWDTSLGAYRIYKAQGDLSEPSWPEQSFGDLLEIAFRECTIDSEKHLVVRQLRGLI